MKKVWQKPKLVVLYRAKPEEAVLNNCKRSLENCTGNTNNANCLVFSCMDRCWYDADS